LSRSIGMTSANYR